MCVCVCVCVALAVLFACVFKVHRVCHVAFTQFQCNAYCLHPPTRPPRRLSYGLLTTADHRVYMRTLLQITATYITLRVAFSYPDHIPARTNRRGISVEYVLSRVRYGIYNSCQIIWAPPSSYIWVSWNNWNITTQKTCQTPFCPVNQCQVSTYVSFCVNNNNNRNNLKTVNFFVCHLTDAVCYILTRIPTGEMLLSISPPSSFLLQAAFSSTSNKCCHNTEIANFNTISWKISIYDNMFDARGKDWHNTEGITFRIFLSNIYITKRVYCGSRTTTSKLIYCHRRWGCVETAAVWGLRAKKTQHGRINTAPQF